MDHLACFVPGMLALGSAHGAVTGSKAQQYMELAENMTATCYQMYARQPTGAPSLISYTMGPIFNSVSFKFSLAFGVMLSCSWLSAMC